ncbi:MAG: cyclic nucleotide-binding domain-containing protein [Nitrosomonadales bacterium]
MFDEIDDALEWVEDRFLEDARFEKADSKALDLNDFEVFKGRKRETLAALEQCMERRSCKVGDIIFKHGDSGDELFLIRKGTVRIILPISDKQSHHLGTFGRGSFFGEMAFLDDGVRSADAVAFTETELYVLPRKTFDIFAEEHKKVALSLMEGLASVLSSRLRYTDAELRVLES